MIKFIFFFSMMACTVFPIYAVDPMHSVPLNTKIGEEKEYDKSQEDYDKKVANACLDSPKALREIFKEEWNKNLKLSQTNNIHASQKVLSEILLGGNLNPKFAQQIVDTLYCLSSWENQKFMLDLPYEEDHIHPSDITIAKSFQDIDKFNLKEKNSKEEILNYVIFALKKLKNINRSSPIS